MTVTKTRTPFISPASPTLRMVCSSESLGRVSPGIQKLSMRTARKPASRNAVIFASASTSVVARTSSSTAPTTSPGPAVARLGARSATKPTMAVRSPKRTWIR